MIDVASRVRGSLNEWYVFPVPLLVYARETEYRLSELGVILIAGDQDFR